MRISDWSSDVCSSDLGRGVAMAVPVGLEGDLHDLAVVGPAGGDALGAARAATVQQHHVGMLGVDLVERGPDALVIVEVGTARSEEHTSELQSLMRTSYAALCLTQKNTQTYNTLLTYVVSHN